MPDQLHPLIAIVLVVLGLVLTITGSDQLVRGAASLARRLGLSSFVIGVTIVAFGTSAPELFTSVRASLDGAGGLGVGNVVGSNIANICFILGVAALFRPIAASRTIAMRDAPIVLGVSLIATAMMLNQSLSRLEGGALFAGIVAYIWYNLKAGRPDTPQPPPPESDLEPENATPPTDRAFVSSLRTTIGLLGLLAGSWLLVWGSVDLALSMGVSEIVIGATVIAFGTSVPELAASIQAAIRKESDIAIGNILGSNVFNLLVVLGAAAAARPIAISSEMLTIHIPAMLVTIAIIIPIIASRSRIGRIEGGVLVSLYLVYAGYLFISALM
ncbi:MAG: calcium/sodium antiporter [Phycisphaeraceae bacterium]|nr:calcium/sodium antiporter [Phycisphaeraceae bacterium]MCW5761643.1 calcium/sodium antiporter [Phycisphaeraceae bacterium]